MKDSGVEWIGETPASWKIETISRLFKQRNNKVSDLEFEPLSVTKLGIVPQLDSAAKSDDHSNRKLVKTGDFVINSRSDRKMSSGVSNFEGSVSLINLVMIPDSHVLDTNYVNYLMKNYGFAEEFYRWGTGIVADLWSTNWERGKKIQLPVPTIEEQKKIANFLDKKVSKIDEIIHDTKQSIEALQSYKRSIITEKVTQGIRPSGQLKSSGVEWIGEIPDYWDVSKFKYEFYVRGRVGWKGLTASEYIEDKGYAFLSTPDIKGQFIDFTNVVHITKDRYEESPEIMLSVGDVLLTKDGSTIGTNNIVRKLPEPTTVNSSLAVLTTRGRVLPLYLYYWLSSTYVQETANFIRNGMGVPHLFQRDINEFYILIPPESEQLEIINYLENATGKINDLIFAKNTLLDEYESYKKSMIYEYVTGKKQVM